MLEDCAVAARLPAQDLERARTFYADKLGLEPQEERPGGLLYRCVRGEFARIHRMEPPQARAPRWPGRSTTSRRPSGSAPRRVFEEYDTPELVTVDGLAEVPDNYPNKGVGERAAWYKDSEGNLIAIGRPILKS